MKHFLYLLKKMKKDDGHEILAADIRPDDIFKTDFLGV